jgi:hypothetical protein
MLEFDLLLAFIRYKKRIRLLNFSTIIYIRIGVGKEIQAKDLEPNNEKRRHPALNIIVMIIIRNRYTKYP